MCYQERRWHAICNHTIKARFECPRRCAEHGGDIDVVETQLPAYCLACRRQVDSLGVVAALARRPSSNTSRTHGREQPPQQQPQPQQQKPAPTAPLPEPPQRRRRRSDASTLSRAGGLHRSPSERSGRAALGADASGLADAQARRRPQPRQQQTRDGPEGGREDGSRPVLLSPSPQKPLCLRIPDDVAPRPPVAGPHPGFLSSDSLPSLRSSPSATFVSGGKEEEEAERKALAAGTPVTPWTPPSATAIPVPIGKAPREHTAAPLSRFGPAPRAPSTTASHVGGGGGGGGGGARQASLSRSSSLLRGSRSASQLVLAGGTVLFSARPQLVEIASPRRANFPAGRPAARSSSSSSSSSSAASSLTPRPSQGSVPGSPSPSHLQVPLSRVLRGTRSITTLADASCSSSSSSGEEEERAGAAPPARMRMRKPSAANLFPPPAVAGRNRIDIHDPQWLAKHGLKWDAQGLGVVRPAVS